MFFVWFDDLSELGRDAFVQQEWRWCRLGPGSRLEGRASLEDIATILASEPDDVSLLLAARECVHMWLKVPPMSTRSLRQALPFIAEEQVAQPVENMHFVEGDRQGEQLNCLGISKGLLHQLLSLLSDYGISPVAAYSDASLLQAREGTIAVLLDGDRTLVRTSRSALEAPLQDLMIYLKALVQEMGDSSAELHIEVFANESAEIPDGLANSAWKTTLKKVNRSCLAELLSAPITETNLLIGEFEPQASRRGDGGTWRLPLALAATLLALLVASDLVIGFSALKTSESLQEESVALVEGIGTSEEIVRLIHREQGSRSQETRDFLSLLAQISKVSAEHGASIRTLSYQSGSGTIDVEVLVIDYDALDGFSNQAQDTFQLADMLGATQTGEGVRARLRLVGAGR